MTDTQVNTSQAWPSTLLAKFGDKDQMLAVITAIKRCQHRQSLITLLAQYNLTDDELAIAYTKMGTSMMPPVELPKYTQSGGGVLQIGKAKFYAAAWYAGAKYRQIARLMGVKHQSVHNMAGRVLGLQPTPVNHNNVSDEQVAAFKRAWEDDPNADVDTMLEKFMGILATWSD